MEKEAIARYILDFQERKHPELIPRELKISITKNAIVSIIGPRRAGKTYYFYQLMSNLNLNKKDKTRILYLDFEYPELAGITFKEIKEIVNVHRELFGNEPEYLFFSHSRKGLYTILLPSTSTSLSMSSVMASPGFNLNSPIAFISALTSLLSVFSSPIPQQA